MPSKEERIRARAYELWEREGRAHGSHERHWSEAARQVEAEMAAEAQPAVQNAPTPPDSPAMGSADTGEPAPKRASRSRADASATTKRATRAAKPRG